MNVDKLDENGGEWRKTDENGQKRYSSDMVQIGGLKKCAEFI